MTVYKNTQVKYWGDTWKDLKPFDILSIDEIVNRFVQSYNNIGNLKVDEEEKVVTEWLNDSWLESPNTDIGPHIQNNFRANQPNSKFVYVELPYEFYKEHMTDWLWGKTQHFINDGSTQSLSEVKDCIDRGEQWGNPTFAGCCSYSNYMTFKKYGIAHPVFNNGFAYPKRNTHRTAFCSIIESDIPAFFLCSNTNGDVFKKFRVLANKEEKPYFKEGYLELVFNLEDKYIDFVYDGNRVVGKYQVE